MTFDETTTPRTDGGRYDWNTTPAKRKADPAWARAQRFILLLALCAGAWFIAWALWRVVGPAVAGWLG